jgi:DNA replication protein DnaC
MEHSEKRTCQQHGEYETAAIAIGSRHFFKGCPACNAAWERSELEKRQRMENEAKAARIARMHESSLIPKRFKGCSFDNFTASNEGQTKALTVATAYSKSWSQAMERGTCLIFSGKAGTGKTHLACAIANNVIEQGHPAKFTTMANMMRAIKETYNKDSNESESDVLDQLSRVPLLVLDEAGMDYGTDFNKTLMFEVLNARYENVMPTILLTNLDAAALKEYLGERIIDRMREGGGKMVTFNWESQRK